MRFEPIHKETYGKTGCRRIVPGQYIAVDPSGKTRNYIYILIKYLNIK
jgi:hypothetical protein